MQILYFIQQILYFIQSFNGFEKVFFFLISIMNHDPHFKVLSVSGSSINWEKDSREIPNTEFPNTIYQTL